MVSDEDEKNVCKECGSDNLVELDMDNFDDIPMCLKCAKSAQVFQV